MAICIRGISLKAPNSFHAALEKQCTLHFRIVAVADGRTDGQRCVGGAIMAVMAFLPFCLSFPPREKWRRDTKESERINRTEREGLFSKAVDDAKKKNPPPEGFLLGQKSGQGQTCSEV